MYHVCDVRLPGKGNSNSHGARPVHLVITMIKWIRTSRWSIKNSLSAMLQAYFNEAHCSIGPKLAAYTPVASKEGTT
jgi:hypothetical protein